MRHGARHQGRSRARLVVEFSGVNPTETVLDVACGPRILACASARVARRVTGIDITPAMLDRARVFQQA
jgi:ubiquinone/menaquinone biosynthesis C-methylase UbiE